MIASLRPPTLRDTRTRAGSPSTRSSAPTSNRRSSSLAPSTTNAPSTPWGRPTRPMRTRSGRGSVGNLEHVPLLGPSTAGADDAPERTCNPPLLADHLADVVGGDVEAEHDLVLALLGLDAHSVGLVDKPAREPLEQFRHSARARNPRARNPRAQDP